MYLSRIIDREKRVRVSSSSREGGERNDSPRKGCQFFSPRKRDCHRRSNLSSTRVTNRSTRRDTIFGSETRSREIFLVIFMGKSKKWGKYSSRCEKTMNTNIDVRMIEYQDSSKVYWIKYPAK